MKRMLEVVLAVAGIVTAGHAAAQSSYPEKPIRIVVGFPPGGPADIAARLIGQKLAEAWGRPVLVENVPGAAGNIGADRVAKAAPDGYTLGLPNNAAIVVNPNLYKLPYDPVRDLVPISQACMTSHILVVGNAVPARNAGELVALAKARPGELTFASGGSGNPPSPFRTREHEVLELVAQGLDNDAIGKQLHISKRTARNHVSLILSKLGVKTRAQAIVRARDAGFGRKTAD